MLECQQFIIAVMEPPSVIREIVLDLGRGFYIIWGMAAVPDDNSVDLTEVLRSNLRRLWQELSNLNAIGDFVNLEGGGVEQHRDLRLRFHHCANYAAALTIFAEERRPLRVLELGCGSGALSFAFARVMPSDWTLIATDYSRQLIDYAQSIRARDNLMFRYVDIRDFDEQILAGVDGVMFLEVIEHLKPAVARDLLQRLHRGLKPHGLVIISTLDRSPFRRRFSGYHPHQVEYRYETLLAFLSKRENNPFADFQILRLLSTRVIRAAVRAEEFGGYFINRLIGLFRNLAARQPRVNRYQRKLLPLLFWVYGFLPAKRDFDLEGHLADLHLLSHAADFSNSFSLVAVLRKGE
jgi:2-polyprenyl-3-methyl-5-hydroxy-6-metoxy-1,4-benzoquinol methylase